GRCIRIERCEHQAVVGLDVRRSVQPFLARVEIRKPASLSWNTDQFSGVSVSPPMVCTSKVGGVALFSTTDGRPAVATAVPDDLDVVVLVVDENERIPPDVAPTVVTFLRDFGFMPNIYPRFREDTFELSLEDGIVMQDLQEYLSLIECLTHPVEPIVEGHLARLRLISVSKI